MSAGTCGRATYYEDRDPYDDEGPGSWVEVADIPDYPEVTVRYIHVRSSVQPGITFEVTSNTVIGIAKEMGSSNSDHLHLEVQISGTPRDPMNYLRYPPGTQHNYTHPSEIWLSFYVYVPGRPEPRAWY